MTKLPRPDSTSPSATLDTVGIAFPVTDFDVDGCTARVDGLNTPTEAWTYTRRLEGGGFVSTGIGGKAWVEASLPKRASDDDDNSAGLELGPALDVLRDLFAASLQFVHLEPGHRFEDSKLTRVDLVRDFQNVDAQTELLDGLASIDQPGRSKIRRFADPSANRAETLRVGPKAWGCTLYDKHTESGGKAPAGQLRFEARLHQAQLTSAFAVQSGGAFAQVADLARLSGVAGGAEVYWIGGKARGGRRSIVRCGDDGVSLDWQQRAWFERVGFDRAVPAASELQRRFSLLELTPAVSAGLWAYLTLPSWGASVSINTRGKYRRLADDLGLTPCLSERNQETVLRLDYDRGELVREAA